MGFRYAVLGAGMQGTAAAYDLARFGDADEVRLFDVDRARAEQGAERVNRLVDRRVTQAGGFDATDASKTAQVLEGIDACLSAVPYFLNLSLARAAIAAGCHFNDLGGNTSVVEKELALDGEARVADVSVVPDCGVAPGMANVLAAHGLRAIEHPEHVHMRCGGLPQNRGLPLGYKILFAPDGLTNEYFGKALVLRDGKVQEIETFEELETIDFPAPLGKLEAFVTSGGTSTCPKTYLGKLTTYDYKTIRYPGHHAQLKQLKDLGFIDLEPITVKGAPIVPRDVFHAVIKKALSFPEERDLLLLRIDVEGMHQGKKTRYRAQLIDRHDEQTGFTAMERTTAYAATIVTTMQARRQVKPGAQPLELAVDPNLFVEELKKRGFDLSITVQAI